MKYCSDEVSRKIKVLSLWAMVTVVCIHSDPLSLVEDPSAAARMFSGIAGFLKLWAVPFFFVVSGFFFARHIDFDPEFSYPQFLRGKWQGLGLPYILWGGVYGTALSVPLTALVNNSVGRPLLAGTVLDGGSVFCVLDRIFGICGGAPADGALWFVRMLIVFFLLSPIWRMLYIRVSWLLLPLALGLIVVPPAECGMLHLHGFYFYFRFSAIGYLLLGMEVARRGWDVVRLNFLCACLIAGGIGCLAFISGDFLFKRIWELGLLVCVWSAYDVFPVQSSCRLPTIFSLTFWIYCMHHWITSYVGVAFRIVFGKGEWSYWLQIAGIPIMTILLCYYVAIILGKFVPSAFLVLNGGRRSL